MENNFGLFGGIPHDASPEECAALEGYVSGFQKSLAPNAPELWGIGAASMASGIEPLPTTFADSDKDAAWTSTILNEIGLERGDVAFFLFLYPQSVQIWPWCMSCVKRNAPFATGMPTPWDAYRLEMYLRRFRMKLLFGIAAATVEGLKANGYDAAEVLGRADTIIAAPDGVEPLRALGLKPWSAQPIGPILAIDAGDGKGARFDHAQWSLASRNGRLHVTTTSPREAMFTDADTGVEGEVRDVDGEPRVFLATAQSSQ